MGRYDVVPVTMEEAASRAAKNSGLDDGAFRRGDGSIYEGNGMNDGRVRDAYNQIAQERAKAAQGNMVSDLDQQKEGMIQKYDNTSRRQLAENMSGIKRSANQRGLLYSGMRQGQESGAQSEAASSAAGYRAALNASMDKAKEDIMAGRANMGMDQYQQEVNAAGDAYQAALEKRRQSGGILSSIGGALGTVGGFLAGGPVGALAGGMAGKAVF